MNKEELREQLAAIEHERWADWQKYCHTKLTPIDEDALEHYKRWERQIKTPYSKLSDKEKASDMKQVDRYWPLIEQYAQEFSKKRKAMKKMKVLIEFNIGDPDSWIDEESLKEEYQGSYVQYFQKSLDNDDFCLFDLDDSPKVISTVKEVDERGGVSAGKQSEEERVFSEEET